VGTGEVKLKHSVEERFAFVEFRVFWHGRINRADLIQRFGVSPTQASQDFKLYAELMPENLVYDGVEKAYLCGQNFVSRYADLSAESYLAPLLSISSGLLQPEDTLLRSVPSFHVSPNPSRGVNPLVLRAVVRTIDNAEAIEIRYQSMSSPEPSWRWIEPHAFAHDGFRWHIRAFCQNDRIFKDFLLSRIVEVGGQGPVTAESSADEAWHHEVVLEIGPHPDLSDNQRRAIEMDYGMEEGRAQIAVRRALLFYALKRLGLDTDPAARRPQDQQIVLLNRDEVIR
jgi:predicted DNA-binding transcriptional regulator YafY